VLPVLEDKNNHVIDSLRYAIEAVRRNAAVEKVKARPIATVNRW